MKERVGARAVALIDRCRQLLPEMLPACRQDGGDPCQWGVIEAPRFTGIPTRRSHSMSFILTSHCHGLKCVALHGKRHLRLAIGDVTWVLKRATFSPLCWRTGVRSRPSCFAIDASFATRAYWSNAHEDGPISAARQAHRYVQSVPCFPCTRIRETTT